jgi:hypothetical protein
MRLTVWLLLLLNVLVLAYFNLDAAEPVSQAGQAPIQPEKIRLLDAEEIARLPKKLKSVAEPTVARPELGCYEWGSFSQASLPRAREALTGFSLAATPIQQTSGEATRYWVYIPRHGSVQAAQTTLDELRNLGIQESFIVLEPQWRYAISLGVFKDEQLATKLLEEVRTRGVTSATKGVRNQERGQTSLLISNMPADIAAEIEKLKPIFPGSELKQVTCQ